MAITNTTLASPTYNGNGATTAFATGFQFLQNADLLVTVTDSAGVETVKTLTTHYTVTGAGNPSGGTVTMLTAPASGEKLNITSNVTLDQQTDYAEGGSFAAATHETALDKLTKISQQLQAQIDRSIVLPVSNQSVTTTTAPVTAGYVLRVAEDGTSLDWTSPSTVALGTTVSAFAETLLDDADAAEARTTLGIGTLSGSNTGDQNTFSTIAVSGQSNVVADSTTDTLTLVAGTNVTITTDAATDAITINASLGAGTTPVNAGGTGVTSLTAYAPIFGGTTSTNPVQSGTVGTSGQVLTSNGAGALPTFQPPSAGGAGSVVQVVSATVSTPTSTATTIPHDSTVPQNTEGAELVTVSITPTNASNILLIDFIGTFGPTAQYLVTALFQDSTAGALAASVHFGSSNEAAILSLSHRMTAGTTSATTFKIRFGANTGTAYACQDSTLATYGSVLPATIRVFEIKV